MKPRFCSLKGVAKENDCPFGLARYGKSFISLCLGDKQNKDSIILISKLKNTKQKSPITA